MKRSSLLTCVLLASIAQAQTSEPQVKQAELGTWKTYNIKGEKVSASLPTHPAMTTTGRYRELRNQRLTDRMIGAYADGVVYSLYTYENPEPRDSFDNFVATYVETERWDASTARDVKIGRVAGKAYSSSKNRLPATVWFFAVKDRLYKFSATGAPAGDPGVKQFFSSITLDSKGEVEVSDGPGILLPGPSSEELPEPPVGLSPGPPATIAPGPPVGIGPGIGPGLGPGRPEDLPTLPAEPGQKIFTGRQVDTKISLVMKPEPRYTEHARQQLITGTVVLKVVFASNGAVTNIRTVQGLPYGLTEQAIGAARKIKFIPAVKDGKNVSMWIQLEYNFNLY